MSAADRYRSEDCAIWEYDVFIVGTSTYMYMLCISSPAELTGAAYVACVELV